MPFARYRQPFIVDPHGNFVIDHILDQPPDCRAMHIATARDLGLREMRAVSEQQPFDLADPT